jgi:hypothetical protein
MSWFIRFRMRPMSASSGKGSCTSTVQQRSVPPPLSDWLLDNDAPSAASPNVELIIPKRCCQVGPDRSWPAESEQSADSATPCDAGQMAFNVNVGGGQSIFAQASSRVNELDAELRDKHTGEPAQDVKPLVILALGESAKSANRRQPV